MGTFTIPSEQLAHSKKQWPVQYKYMSATIVQTSLTAVSTVGMGRKPLVGTLQNIGQFRKMKERLQAAPKLETCLAIEVAPRNSEFSR